MCFLSCARIHLLATLSILFHASIRRVIDSAIPKKDMKRGRRQYITWQERMRWWMKKKKRKRILLNSSVKCLMISKMHNLNRSTFYIVMVGFRFSLLLSFFSSEVYGFVSFCSFAHSFFLSFVPCGVCVCVCVGCSCLWSNVDDRSPIGGNKR